MKRIILILTTGLLVGQTQAEPAAASRSAAGRLPDLVYRSNAVYSILEAVAAGDTRTLEARIHEGEDVNQRDERGLTALHLAAKANATKSLAILLRAGADPTIRTPGGKTAQELATGKKPASIIKAAVAARNRETELCDKVATGDMEALQEAMHQKRFNPNMLNRDNSASLLILTCRHGSASMVKALIAAGADANYIAPNRRSVLHHAADTNKAEIITTLLAGGADPMSYSGNRATALHDAVWSHKLNSIRALLPAYKNINFSPDGGHNGTPMELAINRGFPQVVQLFIEAGMKLNTPGANNPPLIQAARNGRADIVELLLKAGADKTLRNAAGQCARDVATGNTRNLL